MVLMVNMLCETNRMVASRCCSSLAKSMHLLLEREVADRQHFVEQQDLGLEMRRDRERQAHVHAARIALDRRVDELLDLGEVDDGVELARDLLAAHAEDGAVEEDVLAAGQLAVKAGADFEQRADAAVDARDARRSAR